MIARQLLWNPSGVSPAESARTYFHALQKTTEITTRFDLHATEPYAVLRALGIFLTSWIEGPTLAGALSRRSAAHARQLISFAGEETAEWMSHWRQPLDYSDSLLQQSEVPLHMPGCGTWIYGDARQGTNFPGMTQVIRGGTLDTSWLHPLAVTPPGALTAGLPVVRNAASGL